MILNTKPNSRPRMHQYRLADRVRIDIPDENDVDFEFHGEHGMILSRQDGIYEVALNGGDIVLELIEDEIRPPLY